MPQNAYESYQFAIDSLRGTVWSPFERIFSISGSSSATTGPFSLKSTAGPASLMLMPRTGELGLIVRQVRIRIDGASAWSDGLFAADPALVTGLQFGLYNNATSNLVSAFWLPQPGNTTTWPTTNRLLQWCSDRYDFAVESGVVNGKQLTIWTDFDQTRGPLWIPPGYSLRVGIDGNDTIGSATNVFAHAKGQLVTQ